MTLLLTTACISTQHRNYGGLNDQCLSADDRVLMTAVRGTSLYASARYAAVLREKLTRRGVAAVVHAPEEEWALKNALVDDPANPAHFERLRELGYTYLLTVEWLGQHAPTAISVRNPLEPTRPINTDDPMTRKVVLQFELRPLADSLEGYTLLTTTEINPIGNVDEEGLSVNLSNDDLALRTAVAKAAKEIWRECHCR